MNVMITNMQELEQRLNMAPALGSPPTLKEVINRINYNPQIVNKHKVLSDLVKLIAESREDTSLNPEQADGLTDRLMRAALLSEDNGIEEPQLREKLISVLRDKGSDSEKVSMLLLTGGKINSGISRSSYSAASIRSSFFRPEPPELMTTNYATDSMVELPPSTLKRRQATPQQTLFFSGARHASSPRRSTQERLNTMAPEIGNKWRELGRELGVPQVELESIRQSYSGPTMLQNCAYDMLETARKKFRDETFFMITLRMNLPKVGLDELAHKMNKSDI